MVIQPMWMLRYDVGGGPGNYTLSWSGLTHYDCIDT